MHRNLGNRPANPGASSSVVLFDDLGDATLFANISRVRIPIYLDQNFTVKTWWASSATSPLRLRTTNDYTPGAVKSASAVTCVAKANLVNNDYITVTVGSLTGETSTTVNFEYKVDGDFVATEGYTTIDVSAATTATTVAFATAAALRTAFGALISIPAVTTAVLTMTHAYSGSLHMATVVEHVTDAGFSVALTAGVDGAMVDADVRLLPGRNRVTLHTVTAPTEFDAVTEQNDDPVAS